MYSTFKISTLVSEGSVSIQPSLPNKKIRFSLKALFGVKRVTALLTLTPAAAQTGTVMPARELSIFEVQNLILAGSLHPGVPHVEGGHALTTKNGNASDSDRQTNVPAAIYVGASLPSQPVSPAPAVNAPPVNQYFDFKKSGDSAQVFATAQANAHGTVSWSARVQPSVAGSSPVYVRFVLPKITLTGFTEQDGLGRRQVRYRAEVMVNDHPSGRLNLGRFCFCGGLSAVNRYGAPCYA